ncbi:MAG: phosphoethanolamine transferase [Burkholderiales bacterium]|nr:phosphoethanolamine transferase [Burkholderiales bacterium]
MPSLLRPANLFLLATYALLSAAAYAPYLFGKSLAHPAQVFIIEALCWITLWAAFSRPAWFHWLLLPAFIALPVEIYLQLFYGQGISAHHLGIILETSPKESLEFLGSKIWLLFVITLGVFVWWGLSWYAAFRTSTLNWRGKTRWTALLLIGLGIGFGAYGNQFGYLPRAQAASAANKISAGNVSGEQEEEEEEEDAEEEENSPANSIASSALSPMADVKSTWPKLPAWAKISLELNNFDQSWPFGLGARGYEFWKERDYLGQLARNSHLFKFGAHQPSLGNTPQIVVMVIGESSRYDRWSLNGYARETNPFLKRENNLISLSNVVTAVSATRLSVPILVSRKPATQSLKAGFSEKSFLTAFKEAGFKTYWISNQMSFGQFDTPVSVFANEADVTQFLNLGGFTNHSSYDEILLDPLKIAINDPTPKKLIVLHTLGNHWNYSHRHPKQYDRWQPSLFGVENPVYTDLKIKEQLNNSYDNSILYTDWFLAQVIEVLKSSKTLTSMMYVSDHGQTLYDGACTLAFHGHNTEYEFHVPAMVWYSDLYKKTFPQKIAQLKRNKRAKLATENVFHSLVDLADIRYSSEQLEWSFLSKKFKQHKRYVDSYGWTDYDNATLKGDCKEVIDKGKPLPQEK